VRVPVFEFLGHGCLDGNDGDVKNEVHAGKRVVRVEAREVTSEGVRIRHAAAGGEVDTVFGTLC